MKNQPKSKETKEVMDGMTQVFVHDLDIKEGC